MLSCLMSLFDPVPNSFFSSNKSDVRETRSRRRQIFKVSRWIEEESLIRRNPLRYRSSNTCNISSLDNPPRSSPILVSTPEFLRNNGINTNALPLSSTCLNHSKQICNFTHRILMIDGAEDYPRNFPLLKSIYMDDTSWKMP